jgi:isopenicillin-N epimerase
MNCYIEFGEQTRHDHYLMDQDVVYINQGSYGPCPRFVYNELRDIRLQQEENPDRWFRLLKAELYTKCVRVAAHLLDCNDEQLTLVENVTSGVNAVLKSLSIFTPPDGTILCTNLAYGSILYTIEQAAKQQGMHLRIINIELPIESKQAVIEKFEELKKEDMKNIRLAVIDHITSSTSVVLPIEEITELFHAQGIPVLVDGAHAPNQVHPRLSLSKLKCDFYIGSLHKWMYAARGSSFLFVRDVTIANQIQPANTSWGYYPSSSVYDLGMSHFHLQFFHQGTRDESALFTIPKAVDFADSLAGGFERIYHYNSTLSSEAKMMLEKRWNTQGKDLAPEDMQAPYMKMIRLPDLCEYKKTNEDALRLTNDLIVHHRLVAAIIYINNELYVRISTQIYNRIEDYIFLADTIDKLI